MRELAVLPSPVPVALVPTSKMSEMDNVVFTPCRAALRDDGRRYAHVVLLLKTARKSLREMEDDRGRRSTAPSGEDDDTEQRQRRLAELTSAKIVLCVENLDTLSRLISAESTRLVGTERKSERTTRAKGDPSGAGATTPVAPASAATAAAAGPQMAAAVTSTPSAALTVPPAPTAPSKHSPRVPVPAAAIGGGSTGAAASSAGVLTRGAAPSAATGSLPASARSVASTPLPDAYLEGKNRLLIPEFERRVNSVVQVLFGDSPVPEMKIIFSDTRWLLVQFLSDSDRDQWRRELISVLPRSAWIGFVPASRSLERCNGVNVATGAPLPDTPEKTRLAVLTETALSTFSRGV